MLSSVSPSPRSRAASPRGRKASRALAAGAAGVAAALTLTACTGTDSKPVANAAGASKPAGERVVVNWFVGLGTGADQGQPAQQQKIVDAFNKSQNEITLKVKFVANKSAATTLATQVSAGNAPDIVGPVGIKGANQFDGQWLDLAPLVEKHKFDTSIFAPAQLEASKDRSGAQTALPFGVYPSFLWFNKDAFDEAGLEYPPQKFGDKYADGREWNMETLRELALKLTVDANGKDATEAGFDGSKVVQWGYDPQYGENGPYYHGAFFGPGSFVGEDGKTAQIPPNYLAEWKWYYDLIWKDRAAPNNKQLQSDTLGKGNAFQTGKIAMAFTHSWYLCCMKDNKGKASDFWDIGAIPSYNGKVTAKLHSDSFRIFKSTKNPDAAFKVLSYFLTDAAPDLLKVYNAMPANESLQDDYFASLDETWTQGVEWQVAKDALQYPDIPNHEGWMPNFNKANDRIGQFGQKFISEPGLDIDAEAKKLQADLQKIFAAAK